MINSSKYFEDIVNLSNNVFDDMINSHTDSMDKLAFYNCFSKLGAIFVAIEDFSSFVVQNFDTEPMLKNIKVCGTFIKYQSILNKLLFNLHTLLKEYILNIANMSYLDSDDKKIYIIERYFVSKDYFSSIVQEYYKAAKLLDDYETFSYQTINYQNKGSTILKTHTIDIGTYKSKTILKNELNKAKNNLLTLENKLKKYITENFTIEDLV